MLIDKIKNANTELKKYFYDGMIIKINWKLQKNSIYRKLYTKISMQIIL